jgi:hypothetical protein
MLRALLLVRDGAILAVWLLCLFVGANVAMWLLGGARGPW